MKSVATQAVFRPYLIEKFEFMIRPPVFGDKEELEKGVCLTISWVIIVRRVTINPVRLSIYTGKTGVEVLGCKFPGVA